MSCERNFSSDFTTAQVDKLYTAAKKGNKVVFRDTGCIIDMTSPGQKVSNVGVRWGDKRLQCTRAHAILMKKDGPPEYRYMHCSHRCGIRRCVNTSHLCWQLPWDNVHRDACHLYKYFDECPHSPPCVLQPEGRWGHIKNLLKDAHGMSNRRNKAKKTKW